MKVTTSKEDWENILKQIPETAQPVQETFSATGVAEIGQIVTQRRVIESLQNKQDFFASKLNVLPEVR